MVTETKAKILAYLKEKKQATAKEIIEFLGLSPQAVFRQLKQLRAQGLVAKAGLPPKVFYFSYDKAGSLDSFLAQQINWAVSGEARFLLPEALCPTRDVFQARQERLLKDLLMVINENLAYLLAASVGEIGNNAFDHNLGNWRDVMGLNFAVNLKERKIILADRGQGVLATIKKVRSKTANDVQALRVAFTEIISSRSPEHRGNGLKFVKKVMEENNLSLEFYSGAAICVIGPEGFKINDSQPAIPGTLALIKF